MAMDLETKKVITKKVRESSETKECTTKKAMTKEIN